MPALQDEQVRKEEEARYAKAWSHFRKWPKLALATFLLIWLWAAWSTEHSPSFQEFLIMVFLIVAWLWAARKTQPLCPRCGKEFMYWGHWGRLSRKISLFEWFGKECENCGLPKDAPRDPLAGSFRPSPSYLVGENKENGSDN